MMMINNNNNTTTSAMSYNSNPIKVNTNESLNTAFRFITDQQFELDKKLLQEQYRRLVFEK